MFDIEFDVVAATTNARRRYTNRHTIRYGTARHGIVDTDTKTRRVVGGGKYRERKIG